MKNIHILPSKKQSRLVFLEKLILLDKGWESFATQENNRHIYITSFNKDINENDYVITKDSRLFQVSYLLSKDLVNASKVLLTTDQSLIEEGIRAIDDEFLEWFVKNPSCEDIEVYRKIKC